MLLPPPHPKFRPNSLISYFLTLGTDLPFFLLHLPSWFLAAQWSLDLIALGRYPGDDVVVCLPSDCQLHSVQPLLALSFPLPILSRLLAWPPNIELARRAGTHSLTSLSPEQSFEHGWPPGPEVAFRTPLPHLTIPKYHRGPVTFSLPGSVLCVRGNA